MKITITLPENLNLNAREIQYLLCDAFGEFRSARGNDYVNRRYPEMSESDKREKRIQVSRRIQAAELLRNSCAGGNVKVSFLLDTTND